MSEVQSLKGANIYELMRCFWKENEYEPFSTATIALYHFLIDRANSRRWKMPFSCPTEVAARAVGTSKQTVLNARETLQSRGFLRFTAGSGKKRYSNYWLTLDFTDGLTDNLTDTKTLDKTEQLTEVLTDNLTDDLTVGLTPLNIEYNNIKNKNISLFNKGEKKNFSLEELEEMMMNDEPWLNTVIGSLSPPRSIDLDALKEYLKRFFLHIRTQGFKEREEKDCRKHFVNWMNLQPITNNENKTTKISKYDQSTYNARRATDVTAKSAEQYDGAF